MVFFCIYSHSVFAGDSSWRITQPTWTEKHEVLFSDFVANIAKAVESRRCASVSQCMQSTANIYYGTDPKGLRYFADCADFPYFLRAYFAWKNELPFSYESRVRARTGAGVRGTSDIRYSISGNAVEERTDIITEESIFSKTTHPNAVEVLNETFANYISTASYRVSGLDEGKNFSDFYPVKISKDAIHPGTVLYDPNGHAAMVYSVNPQGRVFYIDAHPDNSLTTGMFTPKFTRSNPGQGAGFKNFRPLTLIEAHQNKNGEYIGGRVVGALNSQLPWFGVEQYVGTNPDVNNWTRGTFVLNGQSLDYYDYVRQKLSGGSQKINPMDDLKSLVLDICSGFKDRVAAVNLAMTSGIQYQPHPYRLPTNIYGSDGDWETYATPSRDARLKTSFVYILEQIKTYLQKFERNDPSLNYQGENLAQDLYEVYANQARACQFSYKTSSGKTVLLNLEAARQRIFNMSFDPYHCVEFRWGARLPEEIESCRDDENKKQWYLQEQWLRNQSERRYDVRMDLRLEDLVGPIPGVGVANPPDTDIVGFLKSRIYSN